MQGQGEGKLTVYQFDASDACMPVMTVLKMGNVTFDKVDINLMEGGNQTEEYKKINRRGQVPTIVDGDFKLTESNAIMKYLIDTRNTIPKTLFPQDKTRIEID
jgi:glutathione S-transferase